MVAYFKRYNNLAMILGGILGAVAALLLWKPVISRQPAIARTLLIALPIFFGIVLGRIIVSRWATAKIGKITNLLYVDGDPEAFIAAFTPILEQTPKQTVEYIDGRVKLAFACEAQGEFDRGLDYLKDLNPDALKMHSLPASAILGNQKIRLLLWKEELEQAQEEMEKLSALRELAMYRAKTLSSQLDHVLDLFQEWYKILSGGVARESYLREEIELAKNRIHRSEMELLLAGSLLNDDNEPEADKLLAQAAEDGKGLFPGRRAQELLDTE